MLRRAWQAWKKIARSIGNFQARLLLTVFYAVLVFPFGIIVRLFSDPLHIKQPSHQWLDHPDEICDLDWARKQ